MDTNSIDKDELRKQKARERASIWWEKNRERGKEACRKWSAEHREIARIRAKKWYQENLCPPCNLKKRSKDPIIFANSLGLLL